MNHVTEQTTILFNKIKGKSVNFLNMKISVLFGLYIKTKGGLLCCRAKKNMIYNIMQIKMSQYGTMGMLVNTLSKSFILSGATKNLLMGSRVSHVLKR